MNLFEKGIDEVDLIMMVECAHNPILEASIEEEIIKDEDLEEQIDDVDNDIDGINMNELEYEEYLNSYDPVDIAIAEELEASSELSTIGDADGELIDLVMKGDI